MPSGQKHPEVHAKLEFEGQVFGNIRVRLKGNSSLNGSRNSIKRPMKLDINGEEKGLKFFGLKKLNLNINAMDASGMREVLAYDLFRAAGVKAPRTALVKVYLTVPGVCEREYTGLYTAVEQVDEVFLHDQFGHKKGVLLKTERVQGLPDVNGGWKTYERRMGVKQTASKETEARLEELIRSLNHDEDAQFARAVAQSLDAEQFLRFVAIEGILANLDSPLLTGHNYYLFEDGKTGRAVMIPWDMNEAFGSFMGGGSRQQQASLSIDQPFTQGFNLANRVSRLPGMRDRQHKIIREICEKWFNPVVLGRKMDQLAAIVTEPIRKDRTVRFAEFERQIATTPKEDPERTQEDRPRPGMMNKPPLRQFINERYTNILAQMDQGGTGYVPVRMGRPPGMGPPNGGPGNGAPPPLRE